MLPGRSRALPGASGRRTPASASTCPADRTGPGRPGPWTRAAATRRPAPAAKAGTAGCATRRTRRGSGRACWSSGGSGRRLAGAGGLHGDRTARAGAGGDLAARRPAGAALTPAWRWAVRGNALWPARSDGAPRPADLHAVMDTQEHRAARPARARQAIRAPPTTSSSTAPSRSARRRLGRRRSGRRRGAPGHRLSIDREAPPDARDVACWVFKTTRPTARWPRLAARHGARLSPVRAPPTVST